MILFHGTYKKSASKIRVKGFRKNECSDFGKAAYFTDSKEVAETYAHKEGEILQVTFTGILLDLQRAEHWELYRNRAGLIPYGFDALKDGCIIAVYNTSKIILI